MMQALRFGVFSPAQQAKLDSVTGGKSLRDAVLGALNPPLDATEQKEFDQLSQIHRQLLWHPVLNGQTPAEAETNILSDLEFDGVFTGKAQQEFDDKFNSMTSADDQRGYLAEAAAYLVAGVETVGKWAKTPTDKTVDALVKAVELLKTRLKF